MLNYLPSDTLNILNMWQDTYPSWPLSEAASCNPPLGMQAQHLPEVCDHPGFTANMEASGFVRAQSVRFQGPPTIVPLVN